MTVITRFTTPILALMVLILAQAQASAASTDDFPAEAMREFSQVYALIRKNYVDQVNDEDLLRNAIRGMVENLDPHSSYLSEEYLEKFNRSLKGLYGGVGLYIDQDRGLIRIVAPIDDSPAVRAGLQTNDFIVEIDGETTEGMAVGDAANLMRGLAGTQVTLAIVRLGEDSREDFEVVLERQEINSPSVRSAIVQNDIGFIRINQFLRDNRTPMELARHVDQLYEESNQALSGLIIDLRNNPGGDLHASICVASIFLDQGLTVVSDRGRNKVDNVHKSDLTNCQAPRSIAKSRTVDIVVLVNNGSASASEIVAGALQDNDRGVIVGTATFGKASVQRVFNIEATDYKSAVKLTSARYYTPTGKSIHNTGIQPDHVIEYIAPDLPEELGDQFSADDLSNLQNVEAKESNFLPLNDNQFEKALEILRNQHTG